MRICDRRLPQESTSSTSTPSCASPGGAAWKEGLAKNPDEVVPYKILPYAADAVKQVVESRLQLFNSQG
jgi:hypothetical protein